MTLAQENWGLCRESVITRTQAIDYGLFATEISADRVTSEDEAWLRFSGEVRAQRDRQTIHADELTLFRDPERIVASGQINFSDNLLDLSATRLELDSENDRGHFDEVSFRLYDSHLRGDARRIDQLDAERRELHDVTYTTCDPGSDAWSLSADRLELDDGTGMGTARHTVMRVAGLPVMYLPWFRFPITDRRISGVLTPTLTSSDRHGTSLAVPWYWNMAPNYDMTITPTWYQRRGLQLNTENRYLFGDHAGQLRLSWLDDDVASDERWFRQWSHQSGGRNGISTSILLQRVSDPAFVDDFGHLDGIEDVDYLRSAVLLSAPFSGWRSALLFEEHQVINEATALSVRPYRRLPRLTVDRRFLRNDGLTWLDWRNEWVAFDRDDSIVGDRLHIAPRLSYPFEASYFFVKPELQLDWTSYALDDNSRGDSDIERALPLLSIDSGLFFERLAGDGQWLQTLEPRLYLLYVPYEDQAEIPLFDTALLTESYHTLFINNRFSGSDRIGDARQASFGLTTRLLRLSGRELLRASIGQAFYAEDRRVSVNDSIDTRDKSNLMTQISIRPSADWQILLGNAYNQQLGQSEQTDIAFRRHRGREIFNLEYHFREDTLEQSTLSFVYPYSANWTLFAKRQHSIRLDRPVQNLAGLRYESCCWRLDLLYEEESDINLTRTDRAVYFQFTFKGLGGAGNDINPVLEDGILGYRTDF